MIGYLEGRILKKDEERILLLANQVGYEVLLPSFVMETLTDKAVGDDMALYIYFHQTERQPVPTLIGFNSEIEKDFFQSFISVEAIGPMKAAKALTRPIGEIAAAIESKDADTLKHLKGIGARTAQKIIATLGGKMDRFTLVSGGKQAVAATPDQEAVAAQVLEVLVEQLGHRMAEAKQMIADALKRNSAIATPEALFDEIYQGE
ncbi:ATP-dependent DNA helicase RuvA [Desulfonema ishimotonii]|uniref:Holliday junction branch migration complex subunit RuvA n=1 Tax=Desulfonema ishimotonii TaxID=45657 RepID=A0A401FX26_9BACT|nr:Holliday junction branch migration protein RuvA [Desulfonema ishimotonii]GBC61521.1 ATP-dependent DNA helicase RuvA [Desulfonema ishimotonii]